MDKISGVVNKLLKKNIGPSNYYQAYLKMYWQEIVGEKLADKCFPLKIEKHCLFIISENSSLNHQLLIMKKELLAQINGYLKLNYLKDLFFINGSLPNKYIVDNYEEKDLNIQKSIRDIVLSDTEINVIKNSLLGLNNQELREKIEQIMIFDCQYKHFLLEKGYKKCEICSLLVDSKQKYCKFCLLDREKIINFELEELLLQVPHINFKDCQKYIKCDKIVYDKVKHKLMDKYKEKVDSENYEPQDLMLYNLLKMEYQ